MKSYEKLLILFAAMLISIPVLSQERPKFQYAEFADKSVAVGGGLEYKQNGNFTLLQIIQATGYKTPFIGRGMTLTSSLGYRYGTSSGFFREQSVCFKPCAGGLKNLIVRSGNPDSLVMKRQGQVMHHGATYGYHMNVHG